MSLGLAISKGFWFGDFPHRAPVAPALEVSVATVTEKDASKQILFGDLHVHSSISLDAYSMALPLASGEGVRPVSDACDFARYCSNLDFFSINDHAQSIYPEVWSSTKQSIRQCNALTNPETPDLVAFLGYEWTQAGTDPSNHYGHKNVIFNETADDKVPTHPVTAKAPEGGRSPKELLPRINQKLALPLVDFRHFNEYMIFNRYIDDMADFYANPCPADTAYAGLPKDCMVQAETPAQLFKMLRDWGGESLVIPHGNTWGEYTPSGTTWDKQLKGDMHDPDRQKLIEVFSGHGNSESYRAWQHVTINADGSKSCPPNSKDFSPGCQRAGVIILQRCLEQGLDKLHCEKLAVKARQDHVDSPRAEFMSIADTTMKDWQDSAQCKDCFLPTYDMRPGGSSQYALAIRNFDKPGKPRRFDFSFIGSSDNHFSRPGTGYKEYGRNGMTEGWITQQPELLDMIASNPDVEDNLQTRVWKDLTKKEKMLTQVRQFERETSYFYTGGLVAVHASDKNRQGIWDALQQGNVYATSGERILLWFDLINDTSAPVAMGGEAQLSSAPKFSVRAVGAFKQNPGCSQRSLQSLDASELDRLCRGECYNPSDEREIISRIEVVRVRPQNYKNEPVHQLIEDKWKVFECPKDSNGCKIEFEDPDFDSAKRDTIYYVRAISEAKLMVNGQTINASYDSDGNFVDSKPCQSRENGDCLGNNEPRAWSSPIFVAYGDQPE